MGGLKRMAIRSLVVSGAIAALGLTLMDSLTERQDFQMVAELPRELSQRGELSEIRASDGTVLGRTCIGYRCIAHIRTDATTRSFGPAFREDSDLRLMRSERRRALMLVADHQPLAVIDTEPSAWEWRSPSIIETGYWLRALPSVVFVAVLGWLVAASLALGRSRISRRLQKLASAVEGRVQDGWLRTSDALAPQRVAFVEGDVLVCREPAPHAPYRGDEHDRTFELIEGDREDNEGPLLRRAQKLDRATVAIAAITALPLFAALVTALLF